jgi:hypothetical protein
LKKMAITDGDNGMVMPVTPMNNGGGFGNNWGGDGWWILLLILAFGGGWGGFGGFGGGGLAAEGSMLYPWMNQAKVTTSGFQNLSTQNQLTAVQSDLGDIQTQLCNGFSCVNATINATASNAETAANARQMANMQQLFGLSQQFADCCCENRLASCQTQNIIQNEGNATRFADANNTRDIIQSQTSGTQAILDKLCQLELDGVKAQVEAKNDRIAELQGQLSAANLAASQTAQNALIQQGFSNEVDALYNRLNSCPVPTTPVYGRTPIFTCNNNNCGCGCNG